MDLSKLCIDPRQRSSWEAIDLGFVMARRWYGPLLVCWSIPCLVVTAIIAAALHERTWLALALIWWCKPLFDRLPLYYISRAIFSEPVSVGDTLARLPSLWRFGSLAWLTIRRLNPTRSFDQPVTVLEHLKGEVRGRRLQSLHRRNTGAAIWLTVVCAHLEALVYIGVLALVGLFIPDQADVSVFSVMTEDTQGVDWINLVLTVLAMMLVAPFYVAAGFALYISRRIELEAWDVEVRFRHLAETRSAGKGAAAALLLLAVMTLTLVMPSPGVASGLNEQSAVSSTAQQVVTVENDGDATRLIDQVLAGEEFHVVKEETRWRLKSFGDESETGERLPEWFIDLVALLEALMFADTDEPAGEPWDAARLATVFEVGLWCAVALVIGLFIYSYRKNIQRLVNRWRSAEQPPEAKPEVLFGLDVTRESLPDNIPQQVNRLCDAGDFRQALSLLYRSTLSSLMHQRGVTFYDSFTEGECVVAVRKVGDPTLSRFTEEVTGFWQNLAYGHRLPPRAAVAELCLQWEALFDAEK